MDQLRTSNVLRPYRDNIGTWVLWLAQFSLGVDGLSVMIWLKDRQAALISIPLLLLWQAVVFVHFYRGFLPSYRSLPPENPELSAVYMHLFRLAMGMPVLLAIIIWTWL
jgi:hypothetical protein